MTFWVDSVERWSDTIGLFGFVFCFFLLFFFFKQHWVQFKNALSRTRLAAQRLGWGLISWCRHKGTSYWEQGERERSRGKDLGKDHPSEPLTSPVPDLYHLSVRTGSVMFEEHGSSMSSTFYFFLTFRNPGKRVELFLHKHFVWKEMGWTFTLSGGDSKHVTLFFHQTLCRFEP